jgi:hypothetical protein
VIRCFEVAPQAPAIGSKGSGSDQLHRQHHVLAGGARHLSKVAMSFSLSISPASQDQLDGFTKAGSAKEPLELIAIEARPVAPEMSLQRAPSYRAVPRMWPAKMSRFTFRLGSWK